MLTNPQKIDDDLANAERLVGALGYGCGPGSSDIRTSVLQKIAAVPTGYAEARKARIAIEVSKQIYCVSADLFSAVLPAAMAVRFARTAADDELLRQALMVQAAVLTDLENLCDAFVAIEEGLELAESRADDHRGRAAAYINLGKACYSAFFFADALDAYRRADHCCVAAGMKTERGLPLANIALCCLEVGQYEEGLAAIRAAIDFMAEPRSAKEHFDRAIAECTYVRLLLACGPDLYAQALARIAFVRRSADLSGSARAAIAASGIEAMCAIFAASLTAGDDGIALHRVRKDHLDAATGDGAKRLLQMVEVARAVPSTLRMALLTAVQALEAAGDCAGALAHHREYRLLMQRQLREKVLRYTRLDVISLSEAAGASCGLAVDLTSSALRSRFVSDAAAGQTESFLLSQAICAEPWDETGHHVFRVGTLVRLLALAFGLDAASAQALDRAARLHDLGMRAMPDSLRSKAWPPTTDEQSIFLQHCADGAELISHSGLPYKALAEEAARHHHERFDGAGFPDCLRGSAIPLAARMVALADTFDVLTHDRRHGEPLSIERALEYIAAQAGTKFDPQLVPLFTQVVGELVARHGAALLDQVLAAEAIDSSIDRARLRLR